MAYRFIKKTHKTKRPARRRKMTIRWKPSGLTDPAKDKLSAAIEEIHEQVVVLAGRGLGQGARSRRPLPKGFPGNTADRCEHVRRGRRGATE